jgi:carotenoid cleavage dioxygenase-like enzyme
VIDPTTGALVSSRDLASVPVELPEVDPRRFGRPYRVMFGVTPGAPSGSEPDPSAFPYFHALVRLDVDTGTTSVWDAGPRRYVSPPAFAPSGEAEGEGWLLAWVFDTERRASELVILDAEHLSAGPIAVLDGGVSLPPSTHTTWIASYAGENTKG